MYNEITLMFKKLVSNIPFNPSLIEQIPEYRASLRKELKLRVIGLSFLVIAFLAQLFISLFPAQPTLAKSPNDLIYGGFSSKAQAQTDCNNNLHGFQEILAYYTISCSDINSTNNAAITTASFHKKIYSLNRLAYGQSPESLVNINNHSYWLRPIWKGNGLDSVSLQALSGVTTTGLHYYILYNSGDIAFVGQPIFSTGCIHNCPELSLSVRDFQSDNANNTKVIPSEEILYTLVASNPTKKTINNFTIGTNFSNALAYSKPTNLYGGTIKNGVVSWPVTSIRSGQTVAKTVAFTVDNPVNKTPLSSTDPNYFNLKMTTTYGNTIVLNLPWSLTKYIELKINNGSLSMLKIYSLIISFLLVLFAAYFVCRNLLILKELKKLKEDYLNGGKN